MKRLIKELAREATESGDFTELAKAYNKPMLALIERILIKHTRTLLETLHEEAKP